MSVLTQESNGKQKSTLLKLLKMSSFCCESSQLTDCSQDLWNIWKYVVPTNPLTKRKDFYIISKIWTKKFYFLLSTINLSTAQIRSSKNVITLKSSSRILNGYTRSMQIRQIGWDNCLERENNLLAEKVSIFKTLGI